MIGAGKVDVFAKTTLFGFTQLQISGIRREMTNNNLK